MPSSILQACAHFALTSICRRLHAGATMAKPKPSDKSRDRYCVMFLGMHRSGTSALTGVLSKLGSEIPTSAMPASKSNAKGFFEFTKVRDLDGDLVASA